MRNRLLALASLVALGACGAAAQNTPRPAPDLRFHLADGNPVQLSKYRGKVVVMEFLFTTCPHCQHTSQILSALNREYGPKGFQPLGVAWNENAIMLVPDFIKTFNVNFPVGVTTREKVAEFMGFAPMARMMVPQTAIIDKKGMIRFQSSVEGAENIHAEKSLREKIEMLLAEPAGAAGPARTGAAPKKAGAAVSAKTK